MAEPKKQKSLRLRPRGRAGASSAQDAQVGRDERQAFVNRLRKDSPALARLLNATSK